MGSDVRTARMSCQLTSIDELKQRNLRPAKRKAIFFRNKLLGLVVKKNRERSGVNFDKNPICAGDIVRVRSKREIRKMLDDHEKYKGCLFIDEMYEHCDMTYRVLKNVEYFFDEAKQKMCKANDILLLEGVTCSGRQRLYKESCDRNCFFFFHKDWVRKVGDRD
jgi:hypothetical protein